MGQAAGGAGEGVAGGGKLISEREVPLASERRIYRAIDPISRAEAESAAKRNDADELLRVVIAVGLHSDDAAWAEAFCLRLAKHKDGNVRGNALLAMG